MLYVTTFEWVKQTVGRTSYEPYKNFVAGFGASLVSNGITTPIDVVSQRQMVIQGDGGGKKFVNGIDVARRIMSVYGVKGFYRGFFVSVLTYAPTSATWWAVRAIFFLSLPLSIYIYVSPSLCITLVLSISFGYASHRVVPELRVLPQSSLLASRRLFIQHPNSVTL